MKVIVRSEKKEKTYQSNCRSCNSVLEFTRSDGEIHNDRNELVLKVKCPVCKSDIWVNA